MEKPDEENFLFTDEETTSCEDEVFEDLTIALKKFLLIMICGFIILTVIYLHSDSIKDAIENIIASCFIGVIIYGLSTLVNPNPEAIPKRK